MKSYLRSFEESYVKRIKSILQQIRTVFGRVFIRSTAYFIFLLLSFAVIVSYFNYREDIQELEEQLAHEGREHTTLVAELAGKDIVNENFDRLERLLRALISEEHVVTARIYSRSGVVIAGDGQMDRRTDPTVLMVMANSEPLFIDGEQFQEYYRPIAWNGEVVGGIYVNMARDEIQAIRNGVFLKILILFGVLLVVFVPLGTYMLHRSTHGISRVTQAANEAAQGFLDTKLVVDTDGEVGELQEAFRTMAINLRDTIQRIEYLAHVDGVTELPNRRKFENAAIQMVDLALNSEGAILFIDLDRFKIVNDMHGHAVGDELLKLVAERIKSLVADLFEGLTKTPPFLARFAGDEFVVILPGMTDVDTLLELSEIIVDKIAKPFRIEPLSLMVRASVGIALYPQDGSTSQEALRCADMAMYSAKEKGRDQAVIFTEQMRETALERQKIERHLVTALENGELAVFYQPKVDLASGKIMGSEALLRWNSPELGAVPPFKFVPLAEECGLMTSIGEFVLRQSLTDMNRLRKEGHDLSVAVNVAPIQFQSVYFADRTLGILGESGFPLDRLELEITESSVMQDPERVMSQIAPIKEEGVCLAIDDFGTGYSSLSTLATMPFDTLKIDRAFVRDMGKDEDRRVIVKLILMMAMQLRMKTVAEGIETPMQHDQLRAWGASYAQGYLWSPPVEFAKFAELVRTGFGPSVEVAADTQQRARGSETGWLQAEMQY